MGAQLLSELPPDLAQLLAYFYSQDAGAAVVWPLVTVCVLVLLVVGLRLWARRIKGLDFGLDDWLIIACTVRLLSSASFSRLFF